MGFSVDWAAERVERILFCGDVHANTRFMCAVLEKAAEVGADLVVQAGDFGWWPRHRLGYRFISKVNAMAEEVGIPVLFCDGNHEDHEMLPIDADHPAALTGSIVYVPRGVAVVLGGSKILFFGGAVSVDKMFRTPGYDWFPEEAPRAGDFLKARLAGHCDAVVSHDAPAGIPLRFWFPADEATERACASVREGLGWLRDELRPSLWVAGHHHQRVTADLCGTRVEVLHKEFPLSRSTLVVDVADLVAATARRQCEDGPR